MSDSNTFTLYCSDSCENYSNTVYPYKHVVHDLATFKAAVCNDCVFAEYKDSRRSIANFITSDCVALDCDNSHSDEPSKWVTPADVAKAFPGVFFGIHYSRNHLKEKDGKAARPKFHVYFRISPTTNAKYYVMLKYKAQEVFPYFDTNAMDAARPFFGTTDPQVEWYEGTKDLSTFLAERGVISTSSQAKKNNSQPVPAQGQAASTNDVIPVGTRNDTLHRFAVKMLKRYGNTEQARELFRQECEKCEQPLPVEEKRAIYVNALKYYNEVIRQQDGYDLPAQFAAGLEQKKAAKAQKEKQEKPSYMPEEFSDVCQAEVLAKHYKKRLCYSPATSYMVYRGNCWIESEPLAQAFAQELTKLQLKEAGRAVNRVSEALKKTGVTNIKKAMGDQSNMSNHQKHLLELFDDLNVYRKYAVSRQSTGRISACLKEVQPMVLVDTEDLDSDPFLLNTPGDTYDLRQGLSGARPASPDDRMTKITAVTPSNEGMQIWLDALNTIFCADQELIDYVQMICGLAAIGQVNLEAMILAYGSGKNFKSTFWNTISRVLGSYSGSISADALTLGCMRNIKPELAEARGKRLLIAAEFPASARLNDSVLKQLCSTDRIQAEKKYKAPFSFVPSHTLVLYTNHLPQVDAKDYGTWRRMIVIPFNATIAANKEKKNYSNFLFEQAGGAVLSWIIEGAQKAFQANFILPTPKVVEEATRKYKAATVQYKAATGENQAATGENKARSDWFKCFLNDCCDVGKDYKANSQELYQRYRQYAYDLDPEKKARGTSEFYGALEKEKFERCYVRNRAYIQGLRLKPTDTLT